MCRWTEELGAIVKEFKWDWCSSSMWTTTIVSQSHPKLDICLYAISEGTMLEGV